MELKHGGPIVSCAQKKAVKFNWLLHPSTALGYRRWHEIVKHVKGSSQKLVGHLFLLGGITYFCCRSTKLIYDMRIFSMFLTFLAIFLFFQFVAGKWFLGLAAIQVIFSFMVAGIFTMVGFGIIDMFLSSDEKK